MVFHLIAHQRLRTGRDRFLDQGHREVRDADVPAQAEFLDMRQRTQRLRQRHPRIWPMQQQQIDFGQMQPGQAFPGRAFEIVRREMRSPHLGGHKQLFAPHS